MCIDGCGMSLQTSSARNTEASVTPTCSARLFESDQSTNSEERTVTDGSASCDPGGGSLTENVHQETGPSQQAGQQKQEGDRSVDGQLETAAKQVTEEPPDEHRQNENSAQVTGDPGDASLIDNSEKLQGITRPSQQAGQQEQEEDGRAGDQLETAAKQAPGESQNENSPEMTAPGGVLLIDKAESVQDTEPPQQTDQHEQLDGRADNQLEASVTEKQTEETEASPESGDTTLPKKTGSVSEEGPGGDSGSQYAEGNHDAENNISAISDVKAIPKNASTQHVHGAKDDGGPASAKKNGSGSHDELTDSRKLDVESTIVDGGKQGSVLDGTTEIEKGAKFANEIRNEHSSQFASLQTPEGIGLQDDVEMKPRGNDRTQETRHGYAADDAGKVDRTNEEHATSQHPPESQGES